SQGIFGGISNQHPPALASSPGEKMRPLSAGILNFTSHTERRFTNENLQKVFGRCSLSRSNACPALSLRCCTGTADTSLKVHGPDGPSYLRQLRCVWVRRDISIPPGYRRSHQTDHAPRSDVQRFCVYRAVR